MPPLALGWPRYGVALKLLDQHGQDSDAGVLWVRSPAVMRGYLNLPALNAQVLSRDGWYCTGDRMQRDAQGAYHFLARDDDMFVCGGENVFPAEVEQLLERHPAVAQACVVPLDDDIKGTKPFAFVVLRAGARCSTDELRQFTLDHGPAFRHARRVWVLPTLPLAPTGKVDRRALRAQAAEQMSTKHSR